MTLRESIARSKRNGVIVTYLGLAWFLVWMALSGAQPPWAFVAFPGFTAFLAGTWYLLFFLRCPRCRGRIGHTVSYMSGPFSVSRKIRFCPFCGVALDSELEVAADAR
jgi:hypothetical protein